MQLKYLFNADNPFVVGNFAFFTHLIHEQKIYK